MICRINVSVSPTRNNATTCTKSVRKMTVDANLFSISLNKFSPARDNLAVWVEDTIRSAICTHLAADRSHGDSSRLGQHPWSGSCRVQESHPDTHGAFWNVCMMRRTDGIIWDCSSAPSQYIDGLSRYMISIIKIGRPWDNLIFITGIPILVKHLSVETFPSIFSPHTRRRENVCSMSASCYVDMMFLYIFM